MTTTLRRDAAQNRQRLLAAAQVVFAEHGLEAGVEEVARVAGVGVGTLYRRFPTKEALIAELVRELLEKVRDLALAALPIDSDAAGHTEDAVDAGKAGGVVTVGAPATGSGLEQFLYATAAAAAHTGCVARLWDDAQTVLLKTEVRVLMARLLDQAQARGRIRADATIADLDLVFWSLRGVIEVAGAVDEAPWRRHLAIMMAGLRPDAQPLTRPPIERGALESIRSGSKGSPGPRRQTS